MNLIHVLLAVVIINGKQINDQSTVTLTVQTPTATPTVTPTPTPAPLVPEPVPWLSPTPLRTVNAPTSSALTIAINRAIPGDLIQLAPGSYGKITISYGTPGEWHGATLEHPLQIVGAPGYASKIVNFGFVNCSYVIVRECSLGTIGMTNSHHMTVADCDILSANTGSLSVAIYVNHDTPNPGGFTFVNNRISWSGQMTPGQWTPGRDGGGIHFQAGKDIGDGNYIAGNVISRFHDGIQCGTMRHLNPSHNLVIERNFIYDCEDDAIELDGCHIGARVSDNVIGGQSQGLTAGISVAPGGPGPILIKSNYIAGFYNLPIKWNTDVDNANTQNCEVTQNTIVQTSQANIGWYFAGPINGVVGLNIHDNIIRARGGIFITEAIMFPGTLDRDWLYTTAEFPYSANAQNPKGCQFRFFDGITNKYYLDFASFQAGTGFEKNGKYSPMVVTPIQIGSFPVEKICRWRITEQ